MPSPRDPALDADVDPTTLSDEEWAAILDPVEHHILRHAGTEPPGTGRYLADPGPGAFHCAGCGQRLYGAAHKFHSGCGWPSFWSEVDKDVLVIYRDRSHGMIRTEMRCSRCDGHMGHIFEDAPQTPTGRRHCVNGQAIVHVPDGEDVLEVFRSHRAAREGRHPGVASRLRRLLGR
ncbi:MAG: peptide-methionine (R)-S-oxide reductase MsrB [Acidimicrobiales bacterium]|nr:peptide-methionine (R)-S-oxide reductase MsrB [Acidimicrobiales bacterium]MEC7949000.1 peptide-methionine (R)-S-oxide reductase MsrB [Myxococcota bacterium]